jgi:hypothetical protein
VLERRRFRVRAPSISKGTIASSTVTDPIVISSCCGFVTRMWISLGSKVTRRIWNSSVGGACAPTRSTSEPPVEENTATIAASASSGASGHSLRTSVI